MCIIVDIDFLVKKVPSVQKIITIDCDRRDKLLQLHFLFSLCWPVISEIFENVPEELAIFIADNKTFKSYEKYF